MVKPLRPLLEAMNFLNVTHTVQYDSEFKEIEVVKREPKAKCTFREFRGVTAVYDEQGCAWVRPWPLSQTEQEKLGVQRGNAPTKKARNTWVPHVDDGGFYINYYFKKLGFEPIEIPAPRHKPR